MKSAEPAITVPVAVLSAHPLLGGREQLQYLGLEGWLEKGTYSPIEVAGWVERWAAGRLLGGARAVPGG